MSFYNTREEAWCGIGPRRIRTSLFNGLIFDIILLCICYFIMKYIINGYIYKNIYNKNLGFLICIELFFLFLLYIATRDTYQRLSYILKTGEIYYPSLCDYNPIKIKF